MRHPGALADEARVPIANPLHRRRFPCRAPCSSAGEARRRSGWSALGDLAPGASFSPTGAFSTGASVVSVRVRDAPFKASATASLPDCRSGDSRPDERPSSAAHERGPGGGTLLATQCLRGPYRRALDRDRSCAPPRRPEDRDDRRGDPGPREQRGREEPEIADRAGRSPSSRRARRRPMRRGLRTEQQRRLAASRPRMRTNSAVWNVPTRTARMGAGSRLTPPRAGSRPVRHARSAAAEHDVPRTAPRPDPAQPPPRGDRSPRSSGRRWGSPGVRGLTVAAIGAAR